MSDAPLPDSLDAFLEHPPTRPEPAELREELRQQTLGKVRRRRRMYLVKSYLTTAAVLLFLWLTVVVFSRGVGLFRELAETTNPGPQAQQAHQPPVHEKPRPQPAPHPDDKPQPPAAKTALPSAVALEWQAFDAPAAQRAALYMQAGDRYAEDEHDLESAVRCYRLAVRASPTVEINRNDNALVMALKLDRIERRKEK